MLNKTSFILIFFILISSFLFAENDIRGRIILKKFNQHAHITVQLLDEKKQVLKESKTIFTGDFKFENVKNGTYILKSMNYSTVINKNSSNLELPTIFIKPSTNKFIMYLFLNLIIFIVITINAIIYYFIHHGEKIKGKKYLLLSLIFISIWFIVDFIRFIIAFFNEYLSARIWPLSHIGLMTAPFLLFYFLLQYPINRKNNLVKILFYLLSLLNFVILLIINSWMILGSDDKFEAFYNFKAVTLQYTFQLSICILFTIAIIILIKNYKENKVTREGQLSLKFVRILSIVIIIVFSFVLYYFIFCIAEPFVGYFIIIISAIDIIIFWNVLKYVFNFFYLRNYITLFSIFIEIFKAILIMMLTFIVLNLFKIDQKYLLIIFVLSTIIFKAIVDLYFNFLINRNKINYENLLLKLESSRDLFDFRKILRRELSKLIKSNDIKLILKIDANHFQRQYFRNLEKINEEIITKNFFIENDINGYDIGFKILLKNEISALLFIETNETHKILKKNELDFLISFSKDISTIINNLIISRSRQSIEKTSFETRALNSVKETFMYTKKFVMLIDEKSDDPEIKSYCKIILERFNKEGK